MLENNRKIFAWGGCCADDDVCGGRGWSEVTFVVGAGTKMENVRTCFSPSSSCVGDGEMTSCEKGGPTIYLRGFLSDKDLRVELVENDDDEEVIRRIRGYKVFLYPHYMAGRAGRGRRAGAESFLSRQRNFTYATPKPARHPLAVTEMQGQRVSSVWGGRGEAEEKNQICVDRRRRRSIAISSTRPMS